MLKEYEFVIMLIGKIDIRYLWFIEEKWLVWNEV